MRKHMLMSKPTLFPTLYQHRDATGNSYFSKVYVEERAMVFAFHAGVSNLSPGLNDKCCKNRGLRCSYLNLFFYPRYVGPELHTTLISTFIKPSIHQDHQYYSDFEMQPYGEYSYSKFWGIRVYSRYQPSLLSSKALRELFHQLYHHHHCR